MRQVHHLLGKLADRPILARILVIVNRGTIWFFKVASKPGVSTRGGRFRRGAKNALPPPARNLFTCRFMLMELMPKARRNSACVQLPLTTNWLANSRKLFRSLSACENTGRQPRK